MFHGFGCMSFVTLLCCRQNDPAQVAPVPVETPAQGPWTNIAGMPLFFFGFPLCSLLRSHWPWWFKWGPFIAVIASDLFIFIIAFLLLQVVLLGVFHWCMAMSKGWVCPNMGYICPFLWQITKKSIGFWGILVLDKTRFDLLALRSGFAQTVVTRCSAGL